MAATYPQEVLERLHAIELEMLLAIDQVCRAHDITYYLDAGSCLGAVRHGGFVPWDDDIDIAMPLPDYRRFLQVAPRALPEGISVHQADNTRNFPTLWAKVYKDGTRFLTTNEREADVDHRIFIDVFPYVNVDERPKVSAAQHRKLALLQDLSYLNVFEHPLVAQRTRFAKLAAAACVVAHHTFARPFTPAKALRMAQPIMEVERPGSQWRAVFAYANIKQTIPGDIMFPTKPLSFCGHPFPGPADPDAYLRILYGDYLQLPPVEKRHTHTPDVLDFGDGVNVMES